MMTLFILYIIGIIISFALIILLALYEKKVEEESVDDLGSALMLVFGSWITAVAFVLIYKKKYLYILQKGFKKK